MGTYNFLDTDQIIETAAGMSIPEIFKQEGEAAFRDLEAQVLDTVHAYVRCVVSTGGGIVERMENWSKLQSGIVVWLNVDPQVIVDRLTKKGGIENRPLLQTDDPAKTLKDLLDRRQSKYAQADVTICIDSADSTEDDVADKVIRELHDFIDDNPPAWKTAKAKAQAEGLDWVQ
jgi:shikimate kinase